MENNIGFHRSKNKQTMVLVQMMWTCKMYYLSNVIGLMKKTDK